MTSLSPLGLVFGLVMSVRSMLNSPDFFFSNAHVCDNVITAGATACACGVISIIFECLKKIVTAGELDQ